MTRTDPGVRDGAHQPTDPFTAVTGNRLSAYAALAEVGPVHRITMPSGAPAWLVTGHDEVRRALTDKRVVKGRPMHGALAATLRPGVAAAIYQHLLYQNPPDHTRLRGLVSAAFTRRRMEALAPRIERIAGSLLDALDGRDGADLIATFAYPLPMTVICELLGVPEPARADFRSWTSTRSPARSRARARTWRRRARWSTTSGRCWTRSAALGGRATAPTTCSPRWSRCATAATGCPRTS